MVLLLVIGLPGAEGAGGKPRLRLDGGAALIIAATAWREPRGLLIKFMTCAGLILGRSTDGRDGAATALLLMGAGKGELPLTLPNGLPAPNGGEGTGAAADGGTNVNCCG